MSKVSHCKTFWLWGVLSFYWFIVGCRVKKFMNNFEEEAKLLKQSEGGLQLQKIEELYDVLKRLLMNPDERQKLSQSAEKTVKANSGALRKNIELIRST